MGGPPQELDANGRFLGMLPGLKLEERSVDLAPGDLLVAYSDGIPDAVNEKVESYGLERLVALLDGRRTESAEHVCTAIFNEVFTFRGEAAAFDDITVLVTRCEKQPHHGRTE